MRAPFHTVLDDDARPGAVSPDAARGSVGVRRAMGALAATAIGYVAALHLPAIPPTAWYGVACLALIVAACIHRRAAMAALFVAVVLLAGGSFTQRVLTPPHDRVDRFAQADGETLATIEGIVLRGPERSERFAESALPIPPALRTRSDRVLIDAHAVRTAAGDEPARGRVLVRIQRGPAELTLTPGDRVRITGMLSGLRPAANPGERDRRIFLGPDGARAFLRVATSGGGMGLIEHVDAERGVLDRARAAVLGFRHTLAIRAAAALKPEDAAGPGPALLQSLLLGIDDPALADTREAFTNVGLAHVLAISGFHLVVMSGVLLAVIRATGDHGRWEPALVALAVGMYALIVPAEPPIVRSALMLTAFMAIQASGRRYHALAVLAYVALALIIYEPRDLFDLGFQLSAGLTGVLLALGVTAHDRMIGGSATLQGVIVRQSLLSRMLAGFNQLFAVSLACWLAGLPWIATSTGLISPIAALATVVVLPFMIALMWAGYAVLMVAVFAPAAGAALGAALGAMATPIAALVIAIDRIPGSSLFAPKLPVLWALAATALVIYWLARGTRRDWPALIASLALVLWLAAALWPALTRQGLDRGVELRIDQFAVGDGSAVLLRSGGDAVLFDCGSLDSPAVGAHVARAVRALGAGRVRTIIISHADLDHFSGVPDIIRPLGVREALLGSSVIDAALRDERSPEAALVRVLLEHGVEIRAIAQGLVRPLGRAQLQFITPATQPGASDNDRSEVVRVVAPSGRSVLLTADLSAGGMRALEETNVRADVLELPHHGSAHADAFEFFARVDPRVVLQSTGIQRHNDPRWDAQRAGRVWLSTPADGANFAEFLAGGSVRAGALRRDAVKLE